MQRGEGLLGANDGSMLVILLLFVERAWRSIYAAAEIIILQYIGRGAISISISAAMASSFGEFRWQFGVPSPDSLAAAGMKDAGAPDF